VQSFDVESDKVVCMYERGNEKMGESEGERKRRGYELIVQRSES